MKTHTHTPTETQGHAASTRRATIEGDACRSTTNKCACANPAGQAPTASLHAPAGQTTGYFAAARARARVRGRVGGTPWPTIQCLNSPCGTMRLIACDGRIETLFGVWNELLRSAIRDAILARNPLVCYMSHLACHMAVGSRFLCETRISRETLCGTHVLSAYGGALP